MHSFEDGDSPSYQQMPTYRSLVGFMPPTGISRPLPPSSQLSDVPSASTFPSSSQPGAGSTHSSASPRTPIPIGATVGAGVGVVLLLVFLLLLVCRLRRRQQSRVAFMSEDGEQITAGSMRSVDARSSSIRGEAPQMPRLVVAIRGRSLSRSKTRRKFFGRHVAWIRIPTSGPYTWRENGWMQSSHACAKNTPTARRRPTSATMAQAARQRTRPWTTSLVKLLTSCVCLRFAVTKPNT
jgi:hypothetical protein